MRTALCFFLSVLVPAHALAWDSTAEEVQLEGRTKMFKGIEYTGMLPSADSAIALSFTADTEGTLNVDQLADSEVSWPEAMTHTWDSVTRGGTSTLDIKTLLGAAIHIDVLSYEFDVPLWEREFNWGGSSKFDSPLLPGGQNSVLVEIEAEELFGLDYTLDITDDVSVTVGGDIYPTAQVTVTGIEVETNHTIIDAFDGTAMLDLPSDNDGEMLLESRWKGNASGWFGIDLVPWVDVCIDGMGCLDVAEFHYPWDLGTDDHNFASTPTEFEHALPAVMPSANTVDLGSVMVGEEVTIDVNIRNLGDIELEGDATYTGDAVISLVDDDFYATGAMPGTITLHFAPSEEGTFSGALTVLSNDPVNPSIQIPVIGNATPQPIDEFDSGDDSDNVGPSDDLGATRGCGCNATPAGTSLGLFGFGLLGLLVRRRNS